MKLPSGIWSQGCLFALPRWGKSKQGVLKAIGRRSSTLLFALLGKAQTKWWYKTDLVEFDPNGVYSIRPDGESRNKPFWTQFDDLRQPGFLRGLEKPTQNGGMKPTWWNLIPSVFIRLAPMGKVKTRRFERNWTTFVNPAFCAAWKSPPKMVLWNRPFGILSQGCLIPSNRWGKSKQGVLNEIGRPSSTRLFALLGKAHPKWWYESDLVEFDPNGVYSLRPNGKVETRRSERNWTTLVNPAFGAAWKSPPKMVVWNRPGGIWSLGCLFASNRWEKSKQGLLNEIGRPSSTRLFALLGKAHPKWWYETDLVEFDPNGVYSLRPDGESLNKAFWTQLDDLRQPSILRCFEKPTQNGGMKPTWWNLIPSVFIRLAPMGKVETMRFERHWTTLVNPAFCAAWKSPRKMVAWNRSGWIWSQGCLFASHRWGKSKQGVLNAIGRPSSTRLFALLGKAHPKWWYETDLVEFDPHCVYSLRTDGESRNKAFWTQLDDLRQPSILRCFEKPTQNGGMKPTWWNLIPSVFIRFAPMGKVETMRFERHWTTLVNPAFCAAWKSPRKMVAWNRSGWIWCQGCLFASHRWGKSKQGILNAIGRPSSTRLFALLGKAHPKWWYETDLVEFDANGVYSLRNDGESRKKEFSTQFDDLRQPGILGCLEKPTQNGGMKPTWWNLIPRVFIRFALMGKVETRRFERNWTTFVNQAFCATWKSPPKMVVWNRNGKTWSLGCLFASSRWGRSKQGVLNATGRPSSTRLFALLGKAYPKWWYETLLVEYDL